MNNTYSEELSTIHDTVGERDEHPGFALITVFFRIKASNLPPFNMETIDDILSAGIPQWKDVHGKIIASNDGTFSYSFHRDFLFRKIILVEVPYWITDERYARQFSTINIWDEEPKWINSDGDIIATISKNIDKPYLDSDNI